ncbi:MAG: hypothetical protein ABIA04_02175 [Pseudomonadota bacterium]
MGKKNSIIFLLFIFGFLSRFVIAEELEKKLYFYDQLDYGSTANFNPLTFIINGGFDTTQVPEAFSTQDFDEHMETVFYEVFHPFNSLEADGGFSQFLQNEFLSVNVVPNLFLHLFGNGISYKMNEEWLYSRGFKRPYSYLASVLIVYASGFINEGIEKGSTETSDPIADLLIFDPLGMLLFSFEPVCKFVKKYIKPAMWHHQPIYDPVYNKFRNIGLNYAIRPEVYGSKLTPFAYVGMTTLFGLSYEIDKEKHVSAGFGQSMVVPLELEMIYSAGIFYDRNDSLISSLIINGTDNLLFRLNLYPSVLKFHKLRPSFFFGVDKENFQPIFGFGFSFLPFGFGEKV